MKLTDYQHERFYWLYELTFLRARVRVGTITPAQAKSAYKHCQRQLAQLRIKRGKTR